jgi:hypothetical protein
MGFKIGARELEIIEYLQERGEVSYGRLLTDFVPLPSYDTHSTMNRLERMVEKGLIQIVNDKTVRLAI